GDIGDDDGENGNVEDDVAIDDDTVNDDGKDVPDNKKELAVAADGLYENVAVNFNYYIGDLEADESAGFCKWNNEGGSITVDMAVNPLLSWGGWGDANKNPVYEMHSVEGFAGWYNITFTVTDNLSDGSLAGFAVFKSSDTGTPLFECSGWSGSYPEIYAGLLAGEITAVKDGKGYASIEDAGISKEALEALVAEAKKLKEEDYKEKGWKVFSEALTEAEDVLKKESPTSDEIEEAYENLEKAMDALVPNSVIEAEINVQPVALADDFITGADISSYWSLRQSGTVFKDEEGNELTDAEFFKYLHDGGTNWIRIRVWNDPYDSEGHGYGGGNNDVDKAKIMGKLATDAGMRVLIDFHYSDFWADPGKQQAPKAWASMSVDDKADAVYQFTKNSLNELKTAGVDVGMVQVGNETTNGICGVSYNSDGWAAAAKIYNAGSRAVREVDPNCLVAVHFTNPERSGNYASLAKNLNDQNVDYDVFASSYYPFWHGTTDNLTSVLANVAKTYGKKVMVAETSWATTLDDQDGHDNTVRKGQNDTDQPYAFSVQGQADEIRAVVEAANNVNKVEGVAAGSSIGVFYWESAWLSPYYVYEEDGTKNEELYNKNKEAWEQQGSGWAASYGGEYDPEDAGKWYGGSAVDNQAWFGFDGTALATAKVYSYIRTGATAEKAVADVKNPSVTINAGETVAYPEKVTVFFNDGTSEEYAVEWNQDDQAKLDTEKPGEYEVRGTVTCEYTLSDGSSATATKNVTLTITVKPVTVPELINPGFEDEDMSAWVIAGNGTARKNEDPRSGSYGVHFWDESAVKSTVMQRIENLNAGTYTFGGYIQGDSLGTTAEVVANVYDSAGILKETKTASCSLAGWAVWQNPEITGIVLSEGDYLEVGMVVDAVAGGWGTVDDFYLYATSSTPVTPAKEGLWAEWTEEWEELLGDNNTITYTGKAIKPVVKVYDGENLLTNKSYSITYKNNTKVGEANVIIKGKGNYTGSYTMSFNIDYVDLENDSDVSIADLYVAASTNGNPVSVKPVVTWKGKKVNAQLYEVVLPDKSEGAYVTSGTYNVEVKAKENNGIYKGSRKIKITLVNTKADNNAQILMSSVKVNLKAKTKSWKEGGVVLDDEDISLTYKTETLQRGKDYDLSYDNNDQIGTATVIITGTPDKGGKYVGEVRKTFKISGTAIKASAVKLATGSFVYDGTQQKPGVTIEGLKENTDYTVTYQNNINAGKKATAVVTGINGYTGTVKKTFTISAHDVADATVAIDGATAVSYEKGGSKPAVKVNVGGKELVPGTDYTVTYSKNTRVTEGATAELKVKGKGNYKGTKPFNFEIKKQSLKNLTATAPDQTSAQKWNKVNPVITDQNGKTLKKGTDYENTLAYVLYDKNDNVVDTATTQP
ncbi:MAG: glycosyl hydrolase 53 family protein, partial [Lachnospiraceae bacterium]|nr:glycosyl hydrolase 53 family protein [Lachnospiraceae bacterium]